MWLCRSNERPLIRHYKCEVSIHLPSSPSIKLRSDEHETTKNLISKVIHLEGSLVREETY